MIKTAIIYFLTDAILDRVESIISRNMRPVQKARRLAPGVSVKLHDISELMDPEITVYKNPRDESCVLVGYKGKSIPTPGITYVPFNP